MNTTKIGTWTKHPADYEWCVRCPGAKPGDMVEVRSKSGKTKTVKLGRRNLRLARDGVFHLGTPDSISAISGTANERRLVVDGVPFEANQLSRTIWEGDTKSLKYRVSISCGVLDDVYTVQVWCHTTNQWVHNPLISNGRYPHGMSWENATHFLILIWNTK